MKHFDTYKQQGSALITMIIVMPFLILITALYMELTISSFKIAHKDQLRSHAQLATDAGIDIAAQEINLLNTWPGTGSEVELHNDGKIRTTYQVSVVATNADSKAVTSIGRSYTPVTNTTTPSATITIVSDFRAVRSGAFSVVTGVGGLYLSNSAKIVGGEVFVNGEISLKNSAQIGLISTPVNVQVAHQNCPNPADATYPRLCNNGENGEPISILNSARIYGSVKANNQISTLGMSSPGLVASSGVAAQPLPPHDRAAQKAAITSTVDASTVNCSSGTKTLAANLKIVGNVTISGTCKVTVNGNLWITGNFTMSNSSQFIVADSMGTTKPNIMIDGPVVKFSNSAQLKSNVSATGFQVINYWSRASCSPDCADVTGIDLYNTRNDTTIELDNSAEGPNTIFYSRWSRVLISNSGQIGALVGQTVELKNSGTITFGTSTGTGSTFWVIDSYRRVY